MKLRSTLTGLGVGALLALTLTVAPASAAVAPAAVTITGVDLHDGTILKSGSTYYLYGTEYGCGFVWSKGPTTWCGFGVSTASSMSGPWSTPTRLFSPNDVSPFTSMTWQQLCGGGNGSGCFNPRMITRTWGPNDGVPILWFNAPADFARVRANAYYSMGCNSLTGPCGASAGAPYGSTTKPSMYSCSGNGDFSLVYDNPNPPVMLCTMANQTLSSERLTVWGTSGAGGQADLAGATMAEGPGGYRDVSGTWIMTWDAPNCAYCGGTGTLYATAASPLGPWTSPVTPTVGGGDGRKVISGASCGGQARSVSVIDGQAFQYIDLWLGTRNETGAGIHLEPLTYRGVTPAGQVWSPFEPWTC